MSVEERLAKLEYQVDPPCGVAIFRSVLTVALWSPILYSFISELHDLTVRVEKLEKAAATAEAE